MPPQPYPQQPHPQQHGGHYPQPGPQGYGAPPVNVVVNQQTNVRSGSGGWWAALFLLMFGTPMGCILIPLALVLMCVGFQFAPMIAAGFICLFLSKAEMPSQTKMYAILGTLGGGLLLNIIFFVAMHGSGGTSTTP